MITPEQAAEAVRKKQTLYTLSIYETSESQLDSFIPVNVAFGEDGWVVTRVATEYSGCISLSLVFLTKADAWMADAGRLESVARKCQIIAHQLREKAKGGQ